MVWPGVTLAYKSYHFRRDALFYVELTNGLPELLLITLLVLITTVADREAAVFLRRQLQPFPFANLVQVSDEHVGGIAFLAARNRKVDLPKILHAGGVMNGLPDRRH